MLNRSSESGTSVVYLIHKDKPPAACAKKELVAYADFVRFVLEPVPAPTPGVNPKTRAERAASREKDRRAALELARKRALRTGGARPLEGARRVVVAPSVGRRDLGGGAGRATQSSTYLRQSRPF